MIGKQFTTNEGCVCKVVYRNGNSDIIVEFIDEYRAKVHTNSQALKKGQVKNPYFKKKLGVGCLGLMPDGSRPKTTHNGKPTREYTLWSRMLDRCYNKKFWCYDRYGGSGVYVEERWLVFANFLEDIKCLDGYELWLENKEQYSLDKDLRGSHLEIKYYSRDTCCFLSLKDNAREAAQRRIKKQLERDE